MAPTAMAMLMLMLVLLVAPSTAGDHTYNRGDKIPVFVNKVGPYFNTHETYHYYSLPVCRPQKVVFRSLTLGEVLDGDRMAESLYDLRFQEDVRKKTLCAVTLNADSLQQLRRAIEDLYYFEFIVDDLPVRGFIGQLVEQVLPHSHEVYLWNHIEFLLEYNGNQIVAVNVSQRGQEVQLPDVDVEQPFALPVTFSYSVLWRENTRIAFNQRTVQGQSFFPTNLEIHWLSIINSLVLVLLLSGFVILILARMLNKDFARYSKEEEEMELDAELPDDQGWKVIHTDVFRFPAYKSALSAVVGNGCQFLTLGFVIIIMALSGFFNVHRHGSMNTAAVLVYALTCFVSGYVSNRFYCSMEGTNWAWNVVLTACFFAVPFFIIWSVVNSVAWYSGSTQALPATTIILLLLIWLIVGFPLTVIGGISGRRVAAPFDAPCRTKNICREIPAVPFYRSAGVQHIIGGLLPFSAISVELYYIFATVWGRDHYTLYGILMIVFLVLIAVTACISITLTYFQLSAEDYRWWWRSVYSSGFCGVYVLGYALFYFVYRSNMSGTLQTVQFFGYTLLVCYIFFLMLGTVGFLTSLTFVRYIYHNLKLD